MKNKSFTRQLILPLFVLLPILIYGVFELNSLTEDENSLAQIYQRQLDAVLFSIEQYTDDKLRTWTDELDLNFDQLGSEQILESLSEDNAVFRALFIGGTSTDSARLITTSDIYRSAEFEYTIDSLYNSSKTLFSRLRRYKEFDFQKLEVMEETVNAGIHETGVLPFVIGSGEGVRDCLYFFDVQAFFDNVLAPKFQEITRDQFVLVCRRIDDGFPVYATTDDFSSDLLTQTLVPLPKYEVGIAQVGGTVQEVVKRRKRQNLTSLGLLILFLLFGLGLVFRNIRKEVELAQNKADFVSNVSHEIRTPLALINMFAETLLMGRVRTEEKKMEYYGIITKEVSRLTNMVNRILSFSKMEANKRKYSKQEMSVNAVTKEVMNTYSYHLESNGFEYDFVPTDELPHVSADREAIIEVVVNLIDNAMKYSVDTKRVELHTGIEQDMVCITVKDHGMGIPKNQLNKLFEKFYRVPKGDVHDTKGAGLGLTIVKQIMDAHEGKVLVESTEGKGSAFKLLFPAIDN